MQNSKQKNPKKIAIILWAIAGAALLCFFYMLTVDVKGAFFYLAAAVILAGVGFWQYKKHPLVKPDEQRAAAEPCEPQMQAADPTVQKTEVKYIFTKAAGVTYKNDDGTNRQTILRKLKKSLKECDMESGSAYLERYEYNGKPAFFIMTGEGCIGNIPADDAERVNAVYDKISSVEVTPDSFKDDETEKIIYRADVDIRFKE